MKLTPWFSGVTPRRPGVYERALPWGRRFAHWDGLYWHCYADSPAAAARNIGAYSSHQDLYAWRGVVRGAS